MSRLTAKQVVQSELMRWLETEQAAPQMSTKELERCTRIREWGKWALLGESSRQGVKPQLKFVARNLEDTTEWQAISVIGDDDGLAIDAVISDRLGSVDRQILRLIYMFWLPTRAVAGRLGVSRDNVYDRRDMALAYIAGALEKNT